MPDATVAARSSESTSSGTTQQVDVAVVGAGFAGLYLLHRLRKAGFTTVGARRGRRRRRHLVLEPLSRRTLRHSDHRLQLHVRSGSGERVEMVGEIRNPARNPALSRLRRRPLRSAARHPLSHQGHGGDIGIRARNAGGSRPTTARAYPAATTSWPPAVSPRPSRRRSMASRTSRARSISPVAGRMTRSSSPASASRSSARDRRGSRRSR